MAVTGMTGPPVPLALPAHPVLQEPPALQELTVPRVLLVPKELPALVQPLPLAR